MKNMAILLIANTPCQTKIEASSPAMGEPKKEAKVYPRLHLVAYNGSVFSETVLVMGPYIIDRKKPVSPYTIIAVVGYIVILENTRLVIPAPKSPTQIIHFALILSPIAPLIS